MLNTFALSIRALTAGLVVLLLPATLLAEPVRLDAGWELLTDPGASLQAGSLPGAGWRAAKVGLSWNAQFADLRDYVGVAWYRTRFTVPASKASQKVLLRFGAVDYQADVFVNGQAAGSHEGAYTPFTLDVTARVKPGANELVVRVVDPPAAGRGRDPRFPQFNYDELPRGKQNWYIQNGGIWQPVWLDVRPALYIDAVRVTPKVSGEVEIEADLVGAGPTRGVTLKFEVRDAKGAVVLSLPATPVSAAGTGQGERTGSLAAALVAGQPGALHHRRRARRTDPRPRHGSIRLPRVRGA